MNLPKTIRVTADHIAQGLRRSDSACPIACAIREQLPDADPITVQNEYVIVHDADGAARTAQLPGVAACFIFDFDAYVPVEPFEFAVEWINQDGEPS